MAGLIFIFTYLQSIVQTYASERVARDLRTDLTAKISLQDYAYIQRVNPSKLLTNLTSDVDAVKALRYSYIKAQKGDRFATRHLFYWILLFLCLLPFHAEFFFQFLHF